MPKTYLVCWNLKEESEKKKTAHTNNSSKRKKDRKKRKIWKERYTSRSEENGSGSKIERPRKIHESRRSNEWKKEANEKKKRRKEKKNMTSKNNFGLILVSARYALQFGCRKVVQALFGDELDNLSPRKKHTDTHSKSNLSRDQQTVSAVISDWDDFVFFLAISFRTDGTRVAINLFNHGCPHCPR